ncbi:MAG: DNA mismatch repair protein MutS [Oscillospiraceae bacterium]|jgi:DNA mismatch repair protein MutS|nr:DNA mismatch repair protein MutS [Oscillospiraceae bacterium]
MALTQMMRQYLTLKEQFSDAILFFRLGDFYEMFFEDAHLASKELELTLTGRDCGLAERAPMCGVPFHSADTYISRLVQKGYKVAICEQLTDPKETKTLVERGVVRVVTPGTVIEQNMLNEKRNNYLLAVVAEGERAGLAYADVSTGECTVYEVDNLAKALPGEAGRISPMEIIANEATLLSVSGLSFPVPLRLFASSAWAFSDAEKILMEQFNAPSLDVLGLSGWRLAARAAGGLIAYLRETQRNALSHLNHLRLYHTGEYMLLDAAARRNLELTESMRRGGVKGSLLDLLDHTATAMGARRLHSWVEQPLALREAIETRLQAVAELKASPVQMDAFTESLKQVRDVERIVARLAYNSFTPRHCLALRQSFDQVPLLRDLLGDAKTALLAEVLTQLDPLDDVIDCIGRMIDPDAPLTMADGGFIRAGYHPELDKLRQAAAEGKQWIADMEARERESTGIRSLKISFHKVFGYCIEVTKSYYAQVPLQYIRRQTLANAERYVTPELQEIERQILGAAERAVRLEQQLFAALKEKLAGDTQRMQRTAEGIKTLDALLSLAIAAQRNGYVCPTINDEGTLDIIDGRHPVVEKMLKDEPFVPNSTQMNPADQRMLIVTGPNMAGKSTYMRQVALITLMAHMGSFVPAKSANICLTDRIFTRIGASDDLASGQSTFLVEMSETAQILRHATRRSLLILDEIGRGTSTFDGLSIAWAVVEYIAGQAIGAKTLFATHYHELSELEGRLEGVVNFRIAVKEYGEDIIFLRRIERGGADKSFGIHVARLAGVPQPVVARAQEILARLEAANVNQASIGANILETDRSLQQMQVGFADMAPIGLVEELRALDVNSMTPMDALNALFTLREKARRI